MVVVIISLSYSIFRCHNVGMMPVLHISIRRLFFICFTLKKCNFVSVNTSAENKKLGRCVFYCTKKNVSLKYCFFRKI